MPLDPPKSFCTLRGSSYKRSVPMVCPSIGDVLATPLASGPISNGRILKMLSGTYTMKMILHHGCPEEIVSDQGREFCNQFIAR